MTSVLPSAQSLLDDIRTLLIDDGAALSACTTAHMLKVPVVLARKLLAAVLSENRNELRALCVVSGCRQGQRCVLLVPCAASAAAAASMDSSPAADVQLYGVCRSSYADPEIFFTREQSMTAHGVLERQLLAEVHHSSVTVRQVRATISLSPIEHVIILQKFFRSARCWLNEGAWSRRRPLFRSSPKSW
jgi:hypothetical protein